MNTINNTLKHRLSRLSLAMAAAGMLAFGGQALAGPDGQPRLDRLAEKLELTSEQSETIAGLFSAHREQMRELQWRDEDGQRNREAREQARIARQALNEEIAEVLSEEQAERFAAMRERGRSHGRHHSGRGHHGVFARLDLSDEQRQAMAELMETRYEQGHENRQEFRQQMREILTEEQVAQLEAMRAERGGKGKGHGQRSRGGRNNS
jgi:Spy/CpxP family protein refolding chaperone